MMAALHAGCAPPDGGPVLVVVDQDGRPLTEARATLEGLSLRADAGGALAVGPLDAPALLHVEAPGHLAEPVAVGPDDARLVVALWPDDHVALHFGGDVMLGRRYQDPGEGVAPLIPHEDAYAATLALLEPLGRAFALADLSVMNLETVVGRFAVNEAALDASVPNTPDDELPYPGKRWVMQSPPEAVWGAIDALGVDLLVLANNHQADWEDAGVASTLAALGCAARPGFCVGGGHDAAEAALPSVLDAAGLRVGTLAYTSVDGDYVNDQYPLVPDPEAPADEAWMHAERLWGEPDLGVPLAAYTTGGAWQALSAAEPDLDEAGRAALWQSARAAFPGLQDWVARRGHGGANPWDPARAEGEIRALAREVDLTVVQLHMGFQFITAPSEGLREAAALAAAAGADLVIAHHPHVLQGVEWMGDTLVVWSLGNLVFDQNFLVTFSSAMLRVVVGPDGALAEARLLPLRLDGWQPAPVVGERARQVLDEVLEASVNPATALRAEDRSVSARLAPRPAALAAMIQDRNSGLITREDPDLIDLIEDEVALLGAAPLPLGPGLWAGQPPIELGRPLTGLGDFEDLDADGQPDDVEGWVILGADDGVVRIDAASGRRSLELIADPDQSGPSSARLVARVPLPAHRLLDAEGAPLDAPARLGAHLRVWVDGERDLGRLRLVLYHFDDTDPLRLPTSAVLGERLLPFEVEGPGWQELWLELPEGALDPVDGLPVTAVLPYLDLTPPDRFSTLMRVDDFELIEWREAGDELRRASWVRGPAGTHELRNLEVAP